MAGPRTSTGAAGRSSTSVSVPWDASLPKIGFLDLWILELWNPFGVVQDMLWSVTYPPPLPLPRESLRATKEAPPRRRRSYRQVSWSCSGRRNAQDHGKGEAQARRSRTGLDAHTSVRQREGQGGIPEYSAHEAGSSHAQSLLR